MSRISCLSIPLRVRLSWPRRLSLLLRSVVMATFPAGNAGQLCSRSAIWHAPSRETQQRLVDEATANDGSLRDGLATSRKHPKTHPAKSEEPLSRETVRCRSGLPYDARGAALVPHKGRPSAAFSMLPRRRIAVPNWSSALAREMPRATGQAISEISEVVSGQTKIAQVLSWQVVGV